MLLDQRRAGDLVAGEQLGAPIGRRRRGTCRRKTLRLPANAAFGGALPPFLIFLCGGFFITPVTVTRRLTISARSSGAEVP